MVAERKFKNSWRRLDRARYHLSAIQLEWYRLANAPRGTVTRHDEQSGWYTVSFDPSEEARCRAKTTELPLILGEFAYQLRAALDGLIWDAVTLMQNGSEPTDNNRLCFPICREANPDLRKFGLREDSLPVDIIRWLKSIQPGVTQSFVNHTETGLAEALEDIHNLARLDRHRRLRIVAAMPTELLGTR